MVVPTLDWLNLAINVVLPALVALVTNRMASSGLKAVVLLALSAITGYLVSWVDACATVCDSFNWQQTAWTMITGFAVAVLSHFGLLKPMGLTGSNGALQRRFSGGLGGRGRHEGR